MKTHLSVLLTLLLDAPTLAQTPQFPCSVDVDPLICRYRQILLTPTPPGVIRLGDTIAEIARRNGITIAELLRLNPGLESARLVVGSRVRLTQSDPLPSTLRTLGLNPVGSYGMSWPDTPQFEPQMERLRMHRGFLGPMNAQRREACRSGAISQPECSRAFVIRRSGPGDPLAPLPRPLSSRELALLQRIRQADYTPQWRKYGQCNYDWTGWRLHPNGVRTTAAECGGTAIRWQIGVSCSRLMVATHTIASGWSQWKPPAGPESKFRQGEDEMVAALCANTLAPAGTR